MEMETGWRHQNGTAGSFDWNFTRQDLAELLDRLDDRQPQDSPLALAA
ncbi:MAG TPA: hypothetical protein VIJ33_06425 [Solirubrobacteraceae bacterium]